jgi:hypothetical protein
MFNHQYNFDIEIPQELITKEKHNHIFEHLLENKVLIGLCGYGKSGKDTIAKRFIDDYGFHRVAFADNIKREMNKFLKEVVCKDINEREEREVHKLIEEGALVNYKPFTVDRIDFFTEDLELKKILRPYIIWYGEKLREVNGPYYWINKAMEIDANGFDNIILSDVRRSKELDIFMDSNSFKRRSELGFAAASVPGGYPDLKLKPYSSLLFHVNQFGLQDADVLTHECIRIAQENWLFDHTFYVDPRLPDSGPYRNNSINFQMKEVAKKFGINKPDKTISPNQMKFF